MTEQPNIKLEILRYVRDHETPANMRTFAEERGYGEKRVARKVNELSSVLEYGVSPMCPWIVPGREDTVGDKIEAYEND